jgi:reactive intermediate/imine deaminase
MFSWMFMLTGSVCVLFSCATAGASHRTVTFFDSPQAQALHLPFSEAVQVGDTLYLSGRIGNVPGKAALVTGGIAAETEQALNGIRETVTRFGSSVDRIVKCTVFLADMAEKPAMDAVYARFFAGKPPARSAVGTTGLALGARVEIECIAVVKDR